MNNQNEVMLKHFFVSRFDDIKKVSDRYWRIPIPSEFEVLVPTPFNSFASVECTRKQFFDTFLNGKDKEISEVLQCSLQVKYDDDFVTTSKYHSRRRESSFLTLIFDTEGDETYFNFLYRPSGGWKWQTEEIVAIEEAKRKLKEIEELTKLEKHKDNTHLEKSYYRSYKQRDNL